MCGVAGIFAPGGKACVDIVAQMLASIAHRGPDDFGIEKLANGELALGHRRLSILDLSPLGHQPMTLKGTRLWVVYNGEIYNFREVRQELEALGHRFHSGSDTEVVLAGYRAWGLASLERYRGMFAFALWDADEGTLHLVRDRFGVKPLYYALRHGSLAFASELKALHRADFTARRVDPVAVTEYVKFGYVSAPRSIFDDVRVVEPGTVLSFRADLKPQRRCYWSVTSLFDGPATLSLRRELEALDEEVLIDRAEESLCEGFRYRMVSDVPVGLFLSGGIDSSTVATILARRAGLKLKTFTIGYGDLEFDETQYAREVASRLGTEHTEFIVTAAEALKLYERLPDITDEPIGDSSLIPTLMVSQLARRHVTVALSADGADELFGGYARYKVCGAFLNSLGDLTRHAYFLSAEIIDRLPHEWLLNVYRVSRAGGPRFAAFSDKLRKFVRMARARNGFSAYEAAVTEWSSEDCGKLLRSCESADDARRIFAAPTSVNSFERLMHFDAARYLPGDLLTKVDRASMAVSLESREPFLDHVTAQFAAALPLHWKFRDGQSKYILQRILARHLPSRIFSRPKQGFSVPLADWLRGPLREQLENELSTERVTGIGILDPKATERALARFVAGHSSVSASGIWFLLQLQRWADRWLSPVTATGPSAESLPVYVTG